MPILPMPQYNFDYPVTVQSMSSHAADLSAWGQRGWARVEELETANFELKRFAEAIALENETLRKALKKFTD